jgi:hypothetical protein
VDSRRNRGRTHFFLCTVATRVRTLARVKTLYGLTPPRFGLTTFRMWVECTNWLSQQATAVNLEASLIHTLAHSNTNTFYTKRWRNTHIRKISIPICKIGHNVWYNLLNYAVTCIRICYDDWLLDGRTDRPEGTLIASVTGPLICISCRNDYLLYIYYTIWIIVWKIY